MYARGHGIDGPESVGVRFALGRSVSSEPARYGDSLCCAASGMVVVSFAARAAPMHLSAA